MPLSDEFKHLLHYATCGKQDQALLPPLHLNNLVGPGDTFRTLPEHSGTECPMQLFTFNFVQRCWLAQATSLRNFEMSSSRAAATVWVPLVEVGNACMFCVLKEVECTFAIHIHSTMDAAVSQHATSEQRLLLHRWPEASNTVVDNTGIIPSADAGNTACQSGLRKGPFTDCIGSVASKQLEVGKRRQVLQQTSAALFNTCTTL